MRLGLSLVVFVFAIGCSGRPDAPRTPDIVGEWDKLENTLPPVSLTVVRDGAALKARLRLSGTEANGTVVLDSNRLRVQLVGRSQPLTGVLVSRTELRLSAPNGTEYRLLKTSGPQR